MAITRGVYVVSRTIVTFSGRGVCVCVAVAGGRVRPVRHYSRSTESALGRLELLRPPGSLLYASCCEGDSTRAVVGMTVARVTRAARWVCVCV